MSEDLGPTVRSFTDNAMTYHSICDESLSFTVFCEAVKTWGISRVR